MKCPKCGRDMEAGFLQAEAKSGIIWSSKVLPFFLSSWKKDAEMLSNNLRVGTASIPTHICRQCELLLGDYSQREE